MKLCAPRLALVACAYLGACGAPVREGNDDAAPVGDAQLDGVDAPGDASSNVFATASGLVDVFINGTLVGSTQTPGELLATNTALVDGHNVIVLRARKGTAALPFAHAQIGGGFGKAGTSGLWKAKAATSSEASEPVGPWAMLGFDDSAWVNAKDVQIAPMAPFPEDGPARGIWTVSANDATVLLRLELYVPPGVSAEIPDGFGHGVTGGLGGAVVTVTTPAELVAAVAGAAPKIVRVVGVIDFTGSEGPITSTVCYVAQCPAPLQSEYIVDQLGGCDGKPTFSYNYDKAGTTRLAVGSNTTLIGVGPGATIKGKGLSIASSNVIVRNLTITAINPQVVWGGDAIHIENASDVWIDHVRFSLIARQMIVTGKGPTSNITVSWSEFDGRTPYSSSCNGTHFWVMLFVGATDTITVNDNWIHDTAGRGPHAGGLDNATDSIQLVNDYYEHVPGFAAQPITIYAKLLFEGTYFKNVTTPFKIDTTTAPAPGHAFAPVASTVGSTTAQCQAALGRPCTANIASPQNGSFPLDQAVLDGFSTVGPAAIVTPYAAEHVPEVVPHLAGPGHI